MIILTQGAPTISDDYRYSLEYISDIESTSSSEPDRHHFRVRKAPNTDSNPIVYVPTKHDVTPKPTTMEIINLANSILKEKRYDILLTTKEVQNLGNQCAGLFEYVDAKFTDKVLAIVTCHYDSVTNTVSNLGFKKPPSHVYDNSDAIYPGEQIHSDVLKLWEQAALYQGSWDDEEEVFEIPIICDSRGEHGVAVGRMLYFLSLKNLKDVLEDYGDDLYNDLVYFLNEFIPKNIYPQVRKGIQKTFNKGFEQPFPMSTFMETSEYDWFWNWKPKTPGKNAED